VVLKALQVLFQTTCVILFWGHFAGGMIYYWDAYPKLSKVPKLSEFPEILSPVVAFVFHYSTYFKYVGIATAVFLGLGLIIIALGALAILVALAFWAWNAAWRALGRAEPDYVRRARLVAAEDREEYAALMHDARTLSPDSRSRRRHCVSLWLLWPLTLIRAQVVTMRLMRQNRPG
jgi:hypothetical protein